MSSRMEEIDQVENALSFEVLHYDAHAAHETFTRGLCVARSEWHYSAPKAATAETQGSEQLVTAVVHQPTGR